MCAWLWWWPVFGQNDCVCKQSRASIYTECYLPLSCSAISLFNSLSRSLPLLPVPLWDTKVRISWGPTVVFFFLSTSSVEFTSYLESKIPEGAWPSPGFMTSKRMNEPDNQVLILTILVRWTCLQDGNSLITCLHFPRSIKKSESKNNNDQFHHILIDKIIMAYKYVELFFYYSF